MYAHTLNKTIEEASYATWESLRVEIPLTAPYPSSHVLSVSGDYDAAGKKTFTVEISSKDYITIERSYSKSMAEKDVNQAVYLALDSMSELPLENVWTDADLEAAWECFGDIPMNPETECMERSFLHFPMGTHREEIWHWFDARYSKGVCALLSPCSDNDEENG